MLALYFGILLGVAWWVIRRGKDTADDYFLAGRNLGWWVVGASIFASNIGSEHIVGLAGQGAKDGVAMAHYELHAWCLLVLAWVFVPFYARSLVFTMPEFLERRFSTGSRYVLSIVSLITFVVTKIAVGIFAGGVVFSTLMPEFHLSFADFTLDSFWIGSILVVVLTGLYTALGGMRAVVYNDAVQVVVLICGSALLTIYGLIQLGGWSELRRICGSEMFNLWKPIIPGLICFALAKSGKNAGLADALFGPGAAPNASQGAFPLMVQHLLPAGFRGIVVAGLLSALMGSLAGVFNACSTLFTVDLYQKWKPKASQPELVNMGRVATGVMVFIALMWIPVIKGAQGLYEYLQTVQGYLAPPIFVVFFFGVFIKRLNSQGCLWAMVAGLILGVFRMAVDTPVTMKLAGFENGYAQGSFLWSVNNINFQYFSILITLVSAIVMIGVSAMTPAPDYSRIKGLTYGTATDADNAKTYASWDWREVAASAFVLACIIGAYVYFRG